MPWAEESIFRRALRKVEDKATEERLQLVTDFALANNERDAPHVTALVLQLIWRRTPEYKLRLFYALSAIVRRSVAVHGPRSRYVPLWESSLDVVAEQLERLTPEQRIRVARVLRLWWREGVFAPGVVASLQRRFPETLGVAPAVAPPAPAPAASATACPWAAPGCKVILMSKTPSSIESPASPASPPPLIVHFSHRMTKI